MCLVRSRQDSAGELPIQEVQKNIDLIRSKANQSQQHLWNHQQEHDCNEHTQQSRAITIPDNMKSKGFYISSPVNFKSETLSSATITPSATKKKVTALDPKVEKGKRSHPIIVVQHNYHDHSCDSERDRPQHQKPRGGVSIPFPLKLHSMLDKAMAEGYGDVVAWQPHGRCFVVYKTKEFQDIVLPKYFKLSKLSSFQRQLNLYGFQRLTLGRDRGGYYHELFLRQKEFLARDIKRVQVKGTGVRARSNPDQEPNFWTMKWCEPKNEAVRKEDIEVTTSMDIGINKQRMISMWNVPASREEIKVNATSNIPITNTIQPLETTRNPSLVSSMNRFYEPSTIGSCEPSTNINNNTDYLSSHGHGGYMSRRPSNENTVLSFGNKAFHYLDPFQPISLEENKKNYYNENALSSFDAGNLDELFRGI